MKGSGAKRVAAGWFGKTFQPIRLTRTTQYDANMQRWRLFEV